MAIVWRGLGRIPSKKERMGEKSSSNKNEEVFRAYEKRCAYEKRPRQAPI